MNSSTSPLQSAFYISCAPTARIARAMVEQHEYTPIGCNFPTRRGLGVLFVPGPLEHGYSGDDKPGLAVRAYRDHHNRLHRDHKPTLFVVPGFGFVRADICAAIASLAGMTPKEPDHTKLMKLIDKRQAKPRQVRLESEDSEGQTLLVWERLTGRSAATDLNYSTGVSNLCRLLDPKDPLNGIRALFQAEEQERLAAVYTAMHAAKSIDGTPHNAEYRVSLITAPIGLNGYDRWFDLSPCLVVVRKPTPALSPASAGYTFTATTAPTSARHPFIEVFIVSAELAELMIGPDGLAGILPELTPAGWTGGKIMAKSPEGPNITDWTGRQVATNLQLHINKRLKQST